MAPTGLTIDQARAHVALLNLLLSLPDLDVDTERRAAWLKMRLCELLPESESPFDFLDARIALLLEAPRLAA